jgi:1,4-alpha-glucan branching enzyme
MGANLVADGATFRVWAPGADHVYVTLNGVDNYVPRAEDELVKHGDGHWTGFFPGVVDGTTYLYYLTKGQRSSFKRDPWARELDCGIFPDCDCVVRAAEVYPWHDQGFRPPAFHELIVYQFHVGVFYASDAQGNDIRKNRSSKFLDVLDRVEYLVDLGVNAIQPLPLVEFRTTSSLGYNATDIFSPEMDYCVGDGELERYLDKVNAMLEKKHQPKVTRAQITSHVDQLKAFIDVCHLYGLAVLVDVVYNHAGSGLDLDSESMEDFDLSTTPDGLNNLYFTRDNYIGRVFNFGECGVQDFLINNARMFLHEYHADGLRFDEVSKIDDFRGDDFCQDITNTLRSEKPQAPLIAEYWGEFRAKSIETPAQGGFGFDLTYSDRLRDAVRDVIPQSAGGANAVVDIGKLKHGLEKPEGFPFAWQAYNCIENHDLVLDADGNHRKPRIPKLADDANPRSWYARSRSRVAMGLLLTAAGVPMLFMGQEFLEDKLWSDSHDMDGSFIWWGGLEGGDTHMSDFHRFTRDLIWLRRHQPALSGEGMHVYHDENAPRVLAFHRWVPNVGRNLVVVASLSESTYYDHSYRIGFPLPGQWNEIFNSDVYDNFANPAAEGNPGGVWAEDAPRDELPYSAGITIPANAILVFEYAGT